jgi:hypothetical protein
MLDATQESIASSWLSAMADELHNACAVLQAAGNKNVWTGIGYEKADVSAELHWLAVDQDRIGQLGGDLLDQARDDTIAFQTWLEIAKQTREDIAFQAGLAPPDMGFIATAKAVIGSTAADVASYAKAGVDEVKAAGGGFTIGLGLGLVVIAVIAWKLH